MKGYPPYPNLKKNVIRRVNSYPFYPNDANCYANDEKMVIRVIHFIRITRIAYPSNTKGTKYLFMLS